MVSEDKTLYTQIGEVLDSHSEAKVLRRENYLFDSIRTYAGQLTGSHDAYYFVVPRIPARTLGEMNGFMERLPLENLVGGSLGLGRTKENIPFRMNSICNGDDTISFGKLFPNSTISLIHSSQIRMIIATKVPAA